MATLLAVLALGMLFAVFALLGPAERPKPCEGKGGEACDECPVGQGDAAPEDCPSGH